MLALSCKDPSWKHLFTSLTTVKLIPAILVAASNALVDRGGPEVGKSLKAFIRHPVICLCVTGNRGLVHDVVGGGLSIALVMSSMQSTCPPSRPGTVTWHAGIYCASCFSVRAGGLWLSCQAGVRRIALLSVWIECCEAGGQREGKI